MTGTAELVGGCVAAALRLAPGAAGAGRLRRLQRAGPRHPHARRAAGVAAAARLVRGRWPRRSADVAQQVVELLASFAAELRAGAAPEAALRRCATDVTDPLLATRLTRVVELVRLGADGPGALRGAAGADTPELVWLAAGWELALAQGAPLAPVARRIADAARDRLQHRSAVRAELAGPRASARLLAMLPVLGLGLGAALGADPLHVLVATPAGLSCMVGALVLEGAGLRWIGALLRRAERAG